MKKDFSENQLNSFELHKQFKALYDLARFIESEKENIENLSFQKLRKYHQFLSDSPESKMQKLHKEFSKVKALDYQFQIYIMLLERFMGQSLKEYQFMISDSDHASIQKNHEKKIVCVLDSIRSAHNVGTFFRNSDCFGVEKLYLTGLTPSGDHPQVIKTAMNTQRNIPWEYTRETLTVIKRLKENGYLIIAVETTRDAISLSKWKPIDQPIALIFGHEQFGISFEALKESDQAINIPMWGLKNSLNVGVSQGIVLQGILSKMLSI